MQGQVQGSHGQGNGTCKDEASLGIRGEFMHNPVAGPWRRGGRRAQGRRLVGKGGQFGTERIDWQVLPPLGPWQASLIDHHTLLPMDSTCQPSTQCWGQSFPVVKLGTRGNLFATRGSAMGTVCA